MVVGIVDHGAGTRDIRLLHGFGRDWRARAGRRGDRARPRWPAFRRCSASSPRRRRSTATSSTAFVGAGAVARGVVIASMLTFAYTAASCSGCFRRASRPASTPTWRRRRPPGPLFVGPAGLLAVFTVVAGIAPGVLGAAGRRCRGRRSTAAPDDVTCSGRASTRPLLLSVVAIVAGGIGVHVVPRPVAVRPAALSGATASCRRRSGGPRRALRGIERGRPTG